MILARFLWTGGGLGLVPFGPGTFGTLAGVALVYFATRFPGLEQKIIFGLACGITLFGVPLANLAEKIAGKDPKSFVWDEIAGYLVTMFSLPLQSRPWLCVAGGFFVFRIYDILKPWPIASIEEKPGGVAVIADDIVAGLYANVTLHVILLAI